MDDTALGPRQTPLDRTGPADGDAHDDVELQGGDLKREIHQGMQSGSGEGEASRKRKGTALIPDVADIEREPAENQRRPERRPRPAPLHRGLPVILMGITPDSAQALPEGR